jgi:hypothetical protein
MVSKKKNFFEKTLKDLSFLIILLKIIAVFMEGKKIKYVFCFNLNENNLIFKFCYHRKQMGN